MLSKNFFASFLILLYPVFCFSNSWIRINQLGYEPGAVKVAVLISEENIQLKSFQILDAVTDKVVFKSNKVFSEGQWQKFQSTFRLNFSEFNKEGVYYIKVGKIKSPIFRIANGLYNGSADFLLQYIRQQQCGYNPFLKDSCHTHDGFIVYHPEKEGKHIDVVGGWHDASDYLRYVTTSATTTFHLLFAYYKNPQAFQDKYDASGNFGSDGIPDVLNSARWGIDWLLKMNPAKNEMYHQVADDRDHLGFRLPTEDTVSYGKGLERPVYFLNGEPQGLFKYKNRTTGVSSTAAKFASTFAFASLLFNELDQRLAEVLNTKAIDAYEYALQKPGFTQTAPCRAPYFYEEENYFDDLELAAATLNFKNNGKYLEDAIRFGREEKITPWIGKDTARHYQWYPFLNLGHYFIVKSADEEFNREFIGYIKEGLKLIEKKSRSNPFRIGIPFIWCSNNLISSILIQFRLYNELTNDPEFLELEAAHRDWLFGCNPWGTSMIVGFPEWGDYPEDPHSAFSAIYSFPINGGLVDGPVYTSIYKNLIGIRLYKPDEYEQFQTDYIVYHDDYGDYSTNEPTLDGTASLITYLSFLHKSDKIKSERNLIRDQGGIIRFDTTQKKVYLIFSAHEFGEGLDTILKSLRKFDIKASFFFTGDFLRNKKFNGSIKQLIKDGHYLGSHSDKHLLYCDWKNRDSLLINQIEFLNDLKNNLRELRKFGINQKQIKYFLPPFEWYNQRISDWSKTFGLEVINFTPSTYTNADYTTPDMANYRSSEMILQQIDQKLNSSSDAMNGVIFLIHCGTHPDRKDKFYNRLHDLILLLKNFGYEFETLN